MSKPKRHHIVPQLLLRNFSYGKKRNKIYVYDKWKDEVFQTVIVNTAVAGKFYEVELGDGYVASLEEGLSSLEARASTVLKKLLAADSIAGLTLEERVAVAAFVASQFIRTSGLREGIAEMDADIEDRLRAEGADPTMVKLCMPGYDPAKAPTFHRMDKDEIKLMSLRLMSQMAPEFATVITVKAWCLLKSPGPLLFISDHPVCLHNEIDMSPMGNLGLMVKGIEIYLPLTPTRCLGMFCPDVYSDMPDALTLKTEQIPFLNIMQTAFSTRYVYSQKDDFASVRQFLRDHPERHKPRRMAAH